MLYTSRYANPELKTGKYIAVRISLGAPKWNLGYPIAGEIDQLKPFGLFNKYDQYEPFKQAYFRMLDRHGPEVIWDALDRFHAGGKDIVLLCYEDVRKPDDWCHRTAFAEWWLNRTGEIVEELFDPTPDPGQRKAAPAADKAKQVQNIHPIREDDTPMIEQLRMF